MSSPDPRSSLSRRAHWDERHAAKELVEAFGSVDADPILIDEIGSLPAGRALDLGTGDGRNAVWLASRGWHVTAVDFSRVGLDRARALAAANGVDVEWHLADLVEWSPGVGRFDLVIIFFVHLPPDERPDVYARAAAAVAPGGTLLIVGHDRTNRTEGVGGPRDPDVLFTPSEITADLAGFRVDRAEVRRRSPNGPGPIDAIVRAVRVAG